MDANNLQRHSTLCRPIPASPLLAGAGASTPGGVALLLALFGLHFCGEVTRAQDWLLTGAPLTNWTSIASSADGTRLVAGVFGISAGGMGNGSVFTSTNAGTTWTRTRMPTRKNWRCMACSADGMNVFAVGAEPVDAYTSYASMCLSTNGGATWREIAPEENVFEWAWVAMSANGKSVVAASEYSRSKVYISTNSGATWAVTPVGGIDLHSLYAHPGAWSADGTTLVLPGPVLATSTNAGASWVTVDIPALAVAASADGTKLAAVQSPGFIYTSQDAGSTWTPTSAPSNFWWTIATSADGTKLVAGAGTYEGKGSLPIYTSADSGLTWRSNSAPDLGWVSVASSADGCRLFAAQFPTTLDTLAIYALQTAPNPVLEVSRSGGNIVLSWTVPSLPFVLQQNSALGEAGWADLGTLPAVNYGNLHHEVMLPITNGPVFYRLACTNAP